MERAVCPHCGEWLGQRQIRRHLAAAEHDFNLSSSGDEMSDGGNADAEMSDGTDVQMSDGSDAGAPDIPGAVDVPHAVENLGAVDNLGAGSGSEPDLEDDLGLGGGYGNDEGTYSPHPRAAC
jgi:hypothetical protein